MILCEDVCLVLFAPLGTVGACFKCASVFVKFELIFGRSELSTLACSHQCITNTTISVDSVATPPPCEHFDTVSRAEPLSSSLIDSRIDIRTAVCSSFSQE